MKFYSEVTNKLYNSEKDLAKAEAEVKKAEAEKVAQEKAKKAERATRAKEVEKALKEANEAQAKAIQLLKDFTKDYGYFHTSYTIDDATKEVDKVKKTSANMDDFFDVLFSFLN